VKIVLSVINKVPELIAAGEALQDGAGWKT
jgi:hypothetical protein